MPLPVLLVKLWAPSFACIVASFLIMIGGIMHEERLGSCVMHALKFNFRVYPVIHSSKTHRPRREVYHISGTRFSINYLCL